MRKTVVAIMTAVAVLLLPILVSLVLAGLTRRQPLQIGYTWYRAELLPVNRWSFQYGQTPFCGARAVIGCVMVVSQPNKDGICI